MVLTFRIASILAVIAGVGTYADGSSQQQQGEARLRREIDTLNGHMIAAFKRDPASVAAFYSDDAAIIGGGQRLQGRPAIDEYWKGATMFVDWSLETLETGGPSHAPWQYGRSVVHGPAGRRMETYFIGLLVRQPSGDFKFQVDAFTRARQDDGAEAAESTVLAYAKAVERADAKALGDLLDDQFVIVSPAGARDKAQEIEDLVPRTGATVEYFRSDETRTRAFGTLAITTGVLRWKFGGREIERDHSTVCVRRGSDWKILAQQITPRTGAAAPSRPPQPRRGPQPASLNHESVAEAVADAVTRQYVFPDIGAQIGSHVRERIRQGAYDRLSGGDLADALTRDLRTVNNDRHLYVQYQPSAAASARSESPSGPVRQMAGGTPATADLVRRRNYFLNSVERLDGNIGYLDVRRFFGLTDDALDAAAAAMAFLAQTDAMIIDVRYAPGGDVRMVDMLASYFFDKVTPTLATYSRPSNQTIQRSTLERVPGRRRPDVPLYVLTSRDTGSAAEDFAFLLQQAGRATLVGDRTGGAGHMNAILGIGSGYSVSVSVGRTYNPKTNQGWEGAGVQPQVRTTSADALDRAHRLALSGLIEKAPSPAIRQELAWVRDTLDARRTPPSVAVQTLESYAGNYGVRVISVAGGRLWYQRASDAEKLPMLTLSESEFALAEGQRVQFVSGGGSSEMRLLMPDGTHVSFARQK